MTKNRVVGFVMTVGLVLMAAAFLLSGAGHGTLWPLILFFAPVTLLQPLSNLSPTASIFVTLIILIAGPILYGFYAAFVVGTTDDRADRRRKRFRTIMAMHYACFVISAAMIHEEWHYFQKMWSIVPWLIVFSLLVFISLQVIAAYWIARPK